MYDSLQMYTGIGGGIPNQYNTSTRLTAPIFEGKPNNRLFESKIIKVFPNENYALLEPNKFNAKGGVFVHNYLASVLGLSKSYFPEAGSRVLCMAPTTGVSYTFVYILCTLPNTSHIPSDLTKTYNIGTGQTAYSQLKIDDYPKSAQPVPNYSDGLRPVDLTEGELALTNANGVGLLLLNSLAELKGSDLAKIECFVIDDLVRILSMQFQHINAFGEYKILNNEGALNVVWTGTSNEYDTWGNTSNSQKKEGVELAGKNQVKLEIDPSKDFKEEAKWRFQEYIGKLGNFVHRFITDPKSTLKPEDGEHPSGRFNQVTNLDGSYLLQSTSDIVFEHVFKIPVPEFECTIEELDFNKAKVDVYESWEPTGDFFEASYQIRDYSRWFANYYSMAGFLAMRDAKVKVPTQAETNDPSPTCGEEERPYDNPTAVDIFRYSTIRIFKDGSIVLLDGYGSSVHLSNGMVNISAPLDVNITAGNTINLISKNINGVANDQVDFTSVERGINLKSKYWIQEYCEDGPILIHSDRKAWDEPDPTNSLADDADDNFAKELFKNAKQSGIILKAPLSNTLLTCGEGAGGLIIQNRSYVNNASFTVFNPLEFSIKDWIYANEGELSVDSAVSYFSGTIQANQIQCVATTKVATTGQDGLVSHIDEIDASNNALTRFEEMKTRMKDASGKDVEDSANETLKAENFKDLKFKYTPQDDSLIPKYTEIYQPITQNLIQISGPGIKNYDPYSELYGDLNPNKAGNKTINFPLYPTNQNIYKVYNPKKMTESISQELEDNELAPNKIRGNFNLVLPTYKILKKTEVKLNS